MKSLYMYVLFQCNISLGRIRKFLHAENKIQGIVGNRPERSNYFMFEFYLIFIATFKQHIAILNLIVNQKSNIVCTILNNS